MKRYYWYRYVYWTQKLLGLSIQICIRAIKYVIDLFLRKEKRTQ